MNTQLCLDKMVELLNDELSVNLTGIYLHGSLAMGCFNPKSSDIDFIIVVKDKLTKKNVKKITQSVLDLHDEMPYKRGIEFSIILEAHLKPFQYPTPFEYHYSDFHRERYRTDENYFCGGFKDEDLASQIMVAYLRGKCLYGKQLSDICEPIDSKYYIASIYHDIESAEQDVIDNPVYVVLNMCRVLYYLKEGQVSSKKEGGEWGLKSLPQGYLATVQKCLDKYTGIEDELELGNKNLSQFVNYMLHEIKQLIKTKS